MYDVFFAYISVPVIFVAMSSRGRSRRISYLPPDGASTFVAGWLDGEVSAIDQAESQA